jgi:acetyltransferase
LRDLQNTLIRNSNCNCRRISGLWGPDKRGSLPSNIMTIPESQFTPARMSQPRGPLDVFFSPKSVAVVGATENPGSVGRTILWNLMSTPFGGTVYPVNPKRSQVLGIHAYPNVAAIPQPIDLAVIVTPASTVPAIIADCANSGVKGVVIISAGFRETGAAGIELESQVLAQARGANMRIIGPNCLGVMAPGSGLNATFAGAMALAGSVGFLSQSGALCTAILDWSLREMVGFSAFFSLGSMLDVGWGDLIYHLGDDPQTKSIVIYMESIGDARSFLSAAREVALSKPIIIIKPGRTEAAAKAAASHTGSLSGSDDVLAAAFERSGVLRVYTIADVFYMAEVLSKQPRPAGPRLTIVTNAGGPGVLATDSLITGGGELAKLAPDTVEALDAHMPSHWSHGNPVDILGDADAQRYAKAVEIASKDPSSDGLLVILTPQAMTDPAATAQALTSYAKTGKPIIASWMGGRDVAAGEAILNNANIPTFPYPDTAARAFNYMWRYSYNLRALYETPTFAGSAKAGSIEAAAKIIESVRDTGRELLTEVESKKVLEAYDIPTVRTEIARTEDAAILRANEIGYPVVLKLYSETITHKTDVGGVRLNLRDEAAVREAFRLIKSAVPPDKFQGVTVQPMIRIEGYELILGSSIDPQFGPVLLFGSGGQLVEVYKDRALALPPLTTTLARRMIEKTKIYQALQGVRGRKPVDRTVLEALVVKFSQLVVELPLIKEIDINPLLASGDGVIALDARIVLQPASIEPEHLPKPAIRPYPLQYSGDFVMRNGEVCFIRPIRPEDEPLMTGFHRTLSDRSVYMRFFQMLNLDQRIAHERLTRICFIDYDRQIALVAQRDDLETGEQQIIGVSRLIKTRVEGEAEIAVIVSDSHQAQGLGYELIRRLVEFARVEGLKKLTATVLPENTRMRRIFEELGFSMSVDSSEQVVEATLTL